MNTKNNLFILLKNLKFKNLFLNISLISSMKVICILLTGFLIAEIIIIIQMFEKYSSTYSNEEILMMIHNDFINSLSFKKTIIFQPVLFIFIFGGIWYIQAFILIGKMIYFKSEFKNILIAISWLSYFVFLIWPLKNMSQFFIDEIYNNETNSDVNSILCNDYIFPRKTRKKIDDKYYMDRDEYLREINKEEL